MEQKDEQQQAELKAVQKYIDDKRKEGFSKVRASLAASRKFGLTGLKLDDLGKVASYAHGLSKKVGIVETVAVDRKTGKKYDVEKETKKIFGSKEYKDQMTRMGKEEGLGWPEREKHVKEELQEMRGPRSHTAFFHKINAITARRRTANLDIDNAKKKAEAETMRKAIEDEKKETSGMPKRSAEEARALRKQMDAKRAATSESVLDESRTWFGNHKNQGHEEVNQEGKHIGFVWQGPSANWYAEHQYKGKIKGTTKNAVVAHLKKMHNNYHTSGVLDVQESLERGNEGVYDGPDLLARVKNFVKRKIVGEAATEFQAGSEMRTGSVAASAPRKIKLVHKITGAVKGVHTNAADAAAHHKVLGGTSGAYKSVVEEFEELIFIDEGNIPKVSGFTNFKQAAEDWAGHNTSHGRPEYETHVHKIGKTVLHQTTSIGENNKGSRYMIGIFNHKNGPGSEEGFGTHHHPSQTIDESVEELEEGFPLSTSYAAVHVPTEKITHVGSKEQVMKLFKKNGPLKHGEHILAFTMNKKVGDHFPPGEYAKNRYASMVKEETLEEGRPSTRHPLEGHAYHSKSDDSLRYIIKDAGEAARANKGGKSEGKYLDQVNDASTVLHFRKQSGSPDWYKKKYNPAENIKEETLDEKWTVKDTGDVKHFEIRHHGQSVGHVYQGFSGKWYGKHFAKDRTVFAKNSKDEAVAAVKKLQDVAKPEPMKRKMNVEPGKSREDFETRSPLNVEGVIVEINHLVGILKSKSGDKAKVWQKSDGGYQYEVEFASGVKNKYHLSLDQVLDKLEAKGFKMIEEGVGLNNVSWVAVDPKTKIVKRQGSLAEVSKYVKDQAGKLLMAFTMLDNQVGKRYEVVEVDPKIIKEASPGDPSDSTKGDETEDDSDSKDISGAAKKVKDIYSRKKDGSKAEDSREPSGKKEKVSFEPKMDPVVSTVDQ